VVVRRVISSRAQIRHAIDREDTRRTHEEPGLDEKDVTEKAKEIDES
jgi:hypothetical protein